MPAPAPDFSVAICTFNRADDLRWVLQDLTRQTHSSFDVWVIDNNSTDHTRQVVEQQMIDSSNLHYAFEPHIGLSSARNRAIEESTGRVIAFVDDDIRMPPDWLDRLAGVFKETDADAVGGPAIPAWEIPPTFLIKLYANAGLIPGTFNPSPDRALVTWLVGCNMSFKRSLFEEVGQFRTDVGPIGQLPLRCDDVELGERAYAAGKKLLFDPGLALQHKISESRQRVGYILRHAFWVGVSHSMIRRPINRSSATSLHPLKLSVNVCTALGRAVGRYLM